MFSIADIQAEQESDFEELEEGEEQSEEQPIHSYPIRCSFAITKDGAPGALTIDAMCQDGAFVTDNISFYRDAQTGTELTAEADWKRRGLYMGPQVRHACSLVGQKGADDGGGSSTRSTSRSRTSSRSS